MMTWVMSMLVIGLLQKSRHQPPQSRRRAPKKRPGKIQGPIVLRSKVQEDQLLKSLMS
jgi:hypothetical protein